MNRRTPLLAGAAAACTLPVATASHSASFSASRTGAFSAPLSAVEPTRWQIDFCEGLDAIAMLGPLSGQAFYTRHDDGSVAAFARRLPPATITALQSLVAQADALGKLLWPWLALICSGAPHARLVEVIDAFADPARTLRAPFEASPQWQPADWALLLALQERLLAVLRALAAADFAGFWAAGLTAELRAQRDAARQMLAPLDLLPEHERLLGRPLARDLRVSLLRFCRPHGVRVQGLHFLAHVGASEAALRLIGAHEVLHPPFDLRGPVGRSLLAVLSRDPLLARILAQKDRASGYNSLEALAEEAMVQALDQIVQERLGSPAAPAPEPAERWRRADQGIHVLAAAFYGLLKADGYDRTGGSFERWVAAATAQGRLDAPRWPAVAESVLGTDPRAWQPPAR